MNVNMVFLPEQNWPDGSIRSDQIKNLFWADFFRYRYFRGGQLMDKKTDVRDPDEKVVEIEMERLRAFPNHTS